MGHHNSAEVAQPYCQLQVVAIEVASWSHVVAWASDQTSAVIARIGR